MTSAEWDRIVALVSSLWVTTPWEKPTRAAGWLVCNELSYEQARDAVISLARDRQSARQEQLRVPTEQRFSPGPAEVYERAVRLSAPLELPEAPVPEEMLELGSREHMERGRAILRRALERFERRSAAAFDAKYRRRLDE
jgi:hypothetical protein